MPSTIYSISIQDEFVRECFNKEQNKSSLVQTLLYNYFKNKITSYEKPEDIFKRKQELKQEESQLVKAENEFLRISREQEQQLKDSSEKEEKLRQARIKAFSEMLPFFFEIEESCLNDLAEKYEKERTHFPNLFEWGLSNDLKEKEHEVKG